MAWPGLNKGNFDVHLSAAWHVAKAWFCLFVWKSNRLDSRSSIAYTKFENAQCENAYLSFTLNAIIYIPLHLVLELMMHKQGVDVTCLHIYGSYRHLGKWVWSQVCCTNASWWCSNGHPWKQGEACACMCRCSVTCMSTQASQCPQLLGMATSKNLCFLTSIYACMCISALLWCLTRKEKLKR